MSRNQKEYLGHGCKIMHQHVANLIRPSLGGNDGGEMKVVQPPRFSVWIGERPWFPRCLED